MGEPLGIDMPEFQLAPDRREYLRKHGTLIVGKDKAGNKTYSATNVETSVIDDDGTIIYYGTSEANRRENDMRAIEQTPQWILRTLMRLADDSFRHREEREWPETVFITPDRLREVLVMNKVNDDVMPLKLRKRLVQSAPMISRFLIREHPEYGETHFIGIRRRAIKQAEETDDPDQMTIPIVDRKKEKAPLYTLDDYLFPELRGLTADAVTAPGAPIGDA